MTSFPSPAASATEDDGGRRHGEYKVPGGKLVVADLDVVDGVLAHVSISGDFFLEPDEALLEINRSLTGLPEDASAADLAAAVKAALPEDAVLFGFSAEAIAITVRRALAKATGWADHHWNIIGPSVLPTHVNVALDEVLTEEVGAGRRNPTLRFWDWEEPSVVIGSFQSVRNEVHPDGVSRHGISVVRRISGGAPCSWRPVTASPTRSTCRRRSWTASASPTPTVSWTRGSWRPWKRSASARSTCR
jgi:lipoate-protein ligase A